MTSLAQMLVFLFRQWVGICQLTWGFQGVLSCGCVISAGWGLLYSLLLLVRAQSMIQTTEKFAFSRKRYWISFWYKSWWYLKACMTQIHLITSFIVVWRCKMAYVWITCAHWSETDLYFQLWQDKNVLQSFSAHMHCLSKVWKCSHTVYWSWSTALKTELNAQISYQEFERHGQWHKGPQVFASKTNPSKKQA